MKRNKSLNWPYYSSEEIKAVTNVLKSGKVNYLFGSIGKKFEKNFSKYFNIKYSIAVSNGTVALELALRAIGININDEVIVTPRSYYSSASSIIQIGGKPVFADIDIETQNINLNTIKKVVTKKTKAIICVHLGGYPCKMKEIMTYAKKRKLFVIEDCSQAHGAKIHNQYVGTFGDIATWSFCNDKIISTGGEGGMLATNKKKYWKFIWSYKDQGKNFDKYFKKNENNLFKYVHDNIGSNYRMTEMQAAIGIYQLKKLSYWINIRNKYANLLNDILKNFKSITLCKYDINFTNSYYRYYFFINPEFLKKNWSRDKIIEYLNKNKINCGSGTCPEIYLEKSFKKINSIKNIELSNAKKLGEKSIAINIHQNISSRKITHIAKSLSNLFLKVTL